MKNVLKKWKAKTVKGFTLIEMLVVLVIISVLMLLFVPNLAKQKESVTKTGNAAVVKVVENQAELFELNNNKKATLRTLQNDGYITDKQAKAFNDYYAENADAARNVEN